MPFGFVVAFLLLALSLPSSNVFAGAPNIAGIDGAPCAFTSVADAIDSAPSGSTIFIDPGVHFRKIGKIAGKKLTLLPAEPALGIEKCTKAWEDATADALVYDGNGGSDDSNGGLVEVTEESVVQFRHMTLRNATAEYGGIMAVTGEATVVLDDVVIQSGTATVLGGGVYVAGKSSLELVNGARIGDNEALPGSAGGGGVALVNSTLEVHDGAIGEGELFFNTAASHGGGIVAVESTVLLSGEKALVRGNVAGEGGGGIFAVSSSISAENASIDGNIAAMRGGGLYLGGSGSELRMVKANLHSNATTASASDEGGGALFLSGSSLNAELSAVSLTGNESSGIGGAIAATNGASLVLLDECVVLDNTAVGSGGGIYLAGPDSSLALVGTLVSGNVSGVRGGGVFAEDASGVSFSAVSVLENSADYSGGGVYSRLTPITMDNVLVSENTSEKEGGGLTFHLATGTLRNVVVSGNSVSESGGGILIEGSEVTLRTDLSTCDPSSLPADRYCSEIRNNSAPSLGGGVCQFGSATEGFTSSFVADAVLFEGNSAQKKGSALFTGGDQDVQQTSAPTANLTNVLVRSNSGSPALQLENEGVLTLASSTLVENFDKPLYVFDFSTAVGVTNSLFFDNTEGPFVGVGVTFTRWCNGSQEEAAGSLDFFANGANPQFITMARGDFRLAETSPHVDACEVGADHDLDGSSRPRGLAFDAGAFEFPAPTSSTTTTTLPSDGICGDFGGDEEISAADALGALRAAVGTQVCALCICDVDESGSVTVSDALAILRKAVGADVNLSCPPCL